MALSLSVVTPQGSTCLICGVRIPANGFNLHYFVHARALERELAALQETPSEPQGSILAPQTHDVREVGNPILLCASAPNNLGAINDPLWDGNTRAESRTDGVRRSDTTAISNRHGAQQNNSTHGAVRRECHLCKVLLASVSLLHAFIYVHFKAT